ncbi:uncharacterized protein [Henckelia pumila]|uniref:uncharacterized protein n=1 Tax=Henckelia pumila TaxID=405737 RepID=UPI003C6E844B
MNGLADLLYNVYSEKKTARELWKSLDRKYKTEDFRAKKFIVLKFLDYKMIDSKVVISQVQELQVILHDIHAEGMVLSETFQLVAIIEKLSLAWKDFKNDLKHKRKEMNVEELVVRIRIEEDNKGSEKRFFNLDVPKENVIEHGQSSKIKKNTSKFGRDSKLGPKKDNFKRKFFGTCYNCGGPGHKAFECKTLKKNKEINMVEAMSQEFTNMNLCDAISEVNLVGSNPREWWIDTGVTRHVCSDKDMFAILDEFENGEMVYMGNSATSDIKR